MTPNGITYQPGEDAVGEHTLGSITVTDLTGKPETHRFATISELACFAGDFAPIMITFSVIRGNLPDIPQVFVRTHAEARLMVEAVGIAYAASYAARMAELRAELDAERAANLERYRAARLAADAPHMGAGNVAGDDEESLVFADESGA